MKNGDAATATDSIAAKMKIIAEGIKNARLGTLSVAVRLTANPEKAVKNTDKTAKAENGKTYAKYFSFKSLISG